jgi:hypothetical protein
VIAHAGRRLLERVGFLVDPILAVYERRVIRLVGEQRARASAPEASIAWIGRTDLVGHDE